MGTFWSILVINAKVGSLGADLDTLRAELDAMRRSNEALERQLRQQAETMRELE